MPNHPTPPPPRHENRVVKTTSGLWTNRFHSTPATPAPEAICSIARGCGDARTEGAIYFETGLAPAGQVGLDLSLYIKDCPVYLDPRFGVQPLGVTLFEQPSSRGGGSGIFHLIDWVSERDYPNVWDYLAECKLFGVSRKLSPLLAYEKLSGESRLLVVHRKAIVRNWRDYTGPADLYGGYKCPRGWNNHYAWSDVSPPNPSPCCAGIWAQDIVGGDDASDGESHSGITHSVDGIEYHHQDDRLVVRQMPSFAYHARRAPEGVVPDYAPGFFASFPLTRLAVVRGGNAHENFARAGQVQSGVRVEYADR